MITKKATKEDILYALGNTALLKSGDFNNTVKEALELVGTKFEYDDNKKIPKRYKYKDLLKKIGDHYNKENNEDRPMNLKELIEMKFPEGKGKGHGVGICKGVDDYKACILKVKKAEGVDPKTPIFKLPSGFRKKLDAAWVSVKEK